MQCTLLEVSEEQADKILQSLNTTRDSLNKDVEILQEWLKTQPHLPEIMDKRKTFGFLINNKCSIEKTKKNIDMYYTIRSLIPDIYDNINPKKSPIMQKVSDMRGSRWDAGEKRVPWVVLLSSTFFSACNTTQKRYTFHTPASSKLIVKLNGFRTATFYSIQNQSYWVPLPKLTKNLYRVTIFKMREVSFYDDVYPADLFKYLVNLVEVRIGDDLVLGDLAILDATGVTFNFVLKHTPVFMEQMLTIISKVFSLRLKGIYVINCPPWVAHAAAGILNFVKKILKPKIYERIHFCETDEILKDIIPIEILPPDYGGKGMTLEELHSVVVKRFEEFQPQFNKLDELRVNENLRPDVLRNDELLGYYGNFKKLDVD